MKAECRGAVVKAQPTILATSDYFLPGTKGGGAVHALNNMATRLGCEWDFRIVTRDRDLGEATAYPALSGDAWHRQGPAAVRYLAARNRWLHLIALARSTGFSIQYHNSFFSPAFTLPLLLARRLLLIPRRPLVIAPRGEFSPGALKLKAAKKNLYIRFAKLFGLCRDALWHVSTAEEAANVRRLMGASAEVIVAGDCLPASAPFPAGSRPPKLPGRLRIVFLSRICRMKNLASALLTLSDLRGQIDIDIYGPREDWGYWQECEAIIHRLPGNVAVRYGGVVPHAQVPETLGGYHLFYLPTLGENFGFVILEALLAGCPLLISDRTPWRSLAAQGIGWDLPLEEPDRFRAILQQFADMDDETFRRMSDRARSAGGHYVQNDRSVEQTRSLLRRATSG